MKKVISVLLAVLLCSMVMLPAMSAVAAGSKATVQSVSVRSSALMKKASGILDIFVKIKAFFNKILDRFKNLFSGIKNINLNPDFAPEDYETAVKPGGIIESKYIAHGKHEVSYYEKATGETWEKYEVYYPADLAGSNDTFPVIISSNGTGVKASKYSSVFRHYASWGFIAVGNEHNSSWAGDSSEASLAFILEQNENPDSVLYHKIDTDNIGIVGHSQGGFGVVNAITVQPHSDMYKAAVVLSSNAQTNEGLQWTADASLIKASTLILGSDGYADSLLASLESLQLLYSQIPDATSKAMGRRIGVDHGEMLYTADGYVTAWFRWQLMGDEEAAKAFIGEAPELLTNPLYQDQRINLS